MNTDLLYPPWQWDFTRVLAPLEGTVLLVFFQTEGILEKAHCPSVFGGENKSQPHFSHLLVCVCVQLHRVRNSCREGKEITTLGLNAAKWGF